MDQPPLFVSHKVEERNLKQFRCKKQILYFKIIPIPNTLVGRV